MVRSTNIWLIAALNLYGCTVHGEIAVTTKNIALAPSSRRLQQYRLSITPVSLMSTFPLLAHDPVSPNSYTIKAMQFIRAGAEDEDVVTPPNSKAKSGEQSSSASGDNPPPHLLPFRRRRYSFIGGTVIPLLRKIFANQGGGNYGAGWRNMMEVFDWVDVLIVFIWGYAIEPALFFIYSIINTRMKSARAYSESATSKTGKVVSHAGRIACLTYIVELAAEFIEGFVDHTLHIIDGVDLNDDFFRKCPQMFAAILYSHWIAKSLNRYKRNALYDFLSNATHVNKRGNTMTNQLALFPLYDRCLQAVIYFFAVAVVLDITKISVGALLQSVFKFSGVSVFGLFLLAMKGPAEQVLSGIILLGSGKMTVGEKLLLSSGDEGKIEAVGWMETTIRCEYMVFLSYFLFLRLSRDLTRTFLYLTQMNPLFLFIRIFR